MNIFVGNLNFQTSEEQLQDLFSQHGSVDSVRVITDKFSGRSRGFGFVEMANDAEAQAAIDALHGQSVDNREINVNEAKPSTNR